MKLTIAIPTYNRNEILYKKIEKLLPQITDECRVVIFDNCSDVPVKDTIENLMENFSYIDLRIVRNQSRRNYYNLRPRTQNDVELLKKISH